MKHILLVLTILLLFIWGCKDDVDTVTPEIDISGVTAFPINCDTMYRGESFVFDAVFTDNVELGSYNIDIHHNFDHHTHSTEVTECSLSPEKPPVNPFLFIQNFEIPEGLNTFHAQQAISIPADVDTGDYHIMIRVTDHEGWSDMIGLSVKIHER